MSIPYQSPLTNHQSPIRNSQMNKHILRVIRYYLIIAGVYGLFLIILTLVDAARTSALHEWKFLFTPPPADAGRFLSSIARTLNQMTAMIVTACAIAVPLTASFYTPKLIEQFIRNGINRSFFLLLIGATITTEYTSYFIRTTGDVTYPARIMVYISFVLGFASMLCFLPYLYYVFNFLRPEGIVRRIGREIDLELGRAASNSRLLINPPASFRKIRKELIVRIAQLREIVVKSIERSDREIALSALEELQRTVLKYQKQKIKLGKQWFAISPAEIRGFPKEAIEVLIQGRIWFEFEVLHHLELAYVSALTKMWEVVTKIAEIAHIVGKTAHAKKDDNLLALSIKFMNTYMRQCINHSDIRAFYNTSYQYRRLAEYIAKVSPARSLEIIRHLHYYGSAALDKDMAFARDITFYDMGRIVEYVYQNKVEEQRKFLIAFLAPQTDSNQPATYCPFVGAKNDPVAHTTGTIKAILILLSYYLENGLSEEVQVFKDCLQPIDAELVSHAAAELLSVEDKEFWEITDRIINLDYLEESRLLLLKDFIREFTSESSSSKS